MKRHSIGTKITLTVVGTSLVFALIVGTTTFIHLSRVSEVVEMAENAAQVAQIALRLTNAQKDYIAARELTGELRNQILQETRKLDEALKRLTGSDFSPAAHSLLDGLLRQRKRHRELQERFLQTPAGARQERAALQQQLQRSENQMQNTASQLAEEARQSAVGVTRTARGVILIALLGTLLLGTLLALRIAVSISEPLLQLAHLANRIARGDLQSSIQVRSEDEVGMLAETFNRMVERLRQADRWLRESTVSKQMFSDLLRDLSQQISASELLMMETGRQFARRLAGGLREHLATFTDQGLGYLRLEAVDGQRGEVLFVGEGLVESTSGTPYPNDHFTRGFLAETIAKLTGIASNCEEIACVSKGDPVCRFVVYPAQGQQFPPLSSLQASMALSTPLEEATA